MTPLYETAINPTPFRGPAGHAGLWYDKFCDKWRDEDGTWTMKSRGDKDNPKLDWIKALTQTRVGDPVQISETAKRIATLVRRRGGRWWVYTTESRFVTGLGRSHPVENGFAWHPTLGTPYLPGSSVKGLVSAHADEEVQTVCFLDAFPVKPAQLDADVMTPHYSPWDKDHPPGDWRSPTPIPFLTTAAKTAFLFGVIPTRRGAAERMDEVDRWLKEALEWVGGGAKTAVGYGRFVRDKDEEARLAKHLAAEQQAIEDRAKAEREARERAEMLASLSATEREVLAVVEQAPSKSMAPSTAVYKETESGRWAGDAKIEVATWLKRAMLAEKRWKEESKKKKPERDTDYQRTLVVMRWLAGE